MQFIGVVWVVYATGYSLLAALAFAMAFIYAQVTVNDFVIARYHRGRVACAGLCGALLHHLSDLGRRDQHDRCRLHSRGGFDLVLSVTAVIAMGFVVGTAAVALLVNGVERDAKAMQPAE